MGKYRTSVKICNRNRKKIRFANLTINEESLQEDFPIKKSDFCGSSSTSVHDTGVTQINGNLQKYNNFNSHGNSKIRTKRYLILTIYAITLLTSTYLSASTTAQAKPQIYLQPREIYKNDLYSNAGLFNTLLNSNNNKSKGLLGADGGGSKNCTRPSADDFPPDLFSKEARQHGAVIIHFLVSFYLFYALLLVCDEFFVPAVESICRDLKIPSDVAGATFMAVSTSAPELFTNIIGTFVTKGDIGVGTIVGSACFNILIVGAAAGLGAGYAIQNLASPGDKTGVRLEWWPLTRDSFFYLLSIAALILVLNDGRVYWVEALFMLFIYALYVLVLCYNKKLKHWSEQILKDIYELLSINSEDNNNPLRISVVVSKVINVNERTPLLLQVTEKGEVCLPQIDGQSANGGPPYTMNGIKPRKTSELDLVLSKEYDIPAESLDEVLIFNALSRSNSFCQQEEDCSGGLCNAPKENDWKILLEWFISWPIRFALTMTVPDCRQYRFRKWYWVTLVMCVAWIGALSYVISWMVTIIGDTLAIPDSVTGLTFLAAGTSIPEVISSLIVARQGLGSMAFSNTIGSNTFDVLVCLGLPWLIQAAIISNNLDNYIEIQSGGLEYSAVLLVSALILMYIFISVNGFILDQKIGLSCIFMYVIFISFACMLEMNVFFPVNLPTC